MRGTYASIYVLTAVFALLFGARHGDAAHPVGPCGAEGQRACCIGEASFGACRGGLVEKTRRNSGWCKKPPGGIQVQSNGVCVEKRAKGKSKPKKVISECGDDGQRACCVGERVFGACRPGLREIAKPKSGYCGNMPAIQSSGVCVPRKEIHPCGGPFQRACCVGEKNVACNSGLAYIKQWNSGWCEGGLAQSDGKCVPAEPCGGKGERACCVGETDFGPCESGLREEPRANSGYCTNLRNIQSSGVCVEAKKTILPCGREGQRACCVGESSWGPCKSGLYEHPSPNAGWCKGGAAQSSGVCLAPSPCGGKGQRACCVGEGRNCAPGLKEVPGCNGDCTCPAGYSNGMCTKDGTIPEPRSGWLPPAVPATGLKGYADLHMHLFAHMAHGGNLLVGKPYDPRGINVALSSCEDLHGAPHLALVNRASTVGSDTQDMACPATRTVDAPGGAPTFNGWPTWHSTIHQQAYYKWLERAWRGGLRLMVELAVTNEAMCRGTHGVGCDDSMATIDRQIAATKAMEQYIASGNRGGWFVIVTSPAEARAAIRAGKLAVVQGIEVDNLFNCKQGAAHCTPAYVQQKVDEYYDQGVRHFFPIHNFDNAFGGTATWQDIIEVGNKVSEGAWWDTESCPPGYGFKLGQEDIAKQIVYLFGFNETGPMPVHAEVSSCNKRGLTPLGEVLIRTLMNKGVVIDVDHMSNKSLDRTLDLAEGQSPSYPVVASHVQFWELNKPHVRHERMRTRAQLQRIARSGGMIGAMLKDDAQDSDRLGQALTLRYGPVKNTCRHSSRTWAQALQYAVDIMGAPVALGSDFNGIAGHVGPRFGPDACGADEREQQLQRRKLRYPFSLPGFGRFKRQKTGYRTFDFNFDGLAHVGLVPDLLADVQRVGLPQKYIDNLYGSAERYIQLWESAAGTSRTRRATPPGRARPGAE